MLSLVMLIFSIFYWQYPFWGIFGTIIWNYLFKLKFSTKTDSNMQNLMKMLTFSFLDQKNSFRASLDQKFKMFCLKWILVLWNKYAVFDYDVHFICVSDWKCPFWKSLVKKSRIASLVWNVVPVLIQMWCSFLVF